MRTNLLNNPRLKRIKALRKTFSAKMRAHKPPPKHGRIISKYSDYGSDVYAPLKRVGSIPDANTAKIEVLLESAL